MMDISPKVVSGVPLITAYGGGRITCLGQVYTTPIIVRESGVQEWLDIDEQNAVRWESLQQILELDAQVNPEILIIGVGQNTSFVSPSIRQQVSARGISLDVMSCGAACRTYNILVAEGRKVVAGIVPVI